jgi:phytoene desaturase
VRQLGYPTDVVVERSFDPLDWEAMGLERGTPWSLSHTITQSGPFRPSNVDPRVPGLVFAGASTVPGSSVPLVLISGRLAAQRVLAYARETSIVRW